MTLLFSLQAQNTGNRKQAVGGIKLSTRLALAMVSLVVVTTAVLSFITYHSVTGVAISRALDRLVTHARLSATDLKTTLNNVRQDMSMIQGGSGVAQLASRWPRRRLRRKPRRGYARTLPHGCWPSWR